MHRLVEGTRLVEERRLAAEEAARRAAEEAAREQAEAAAAAERADAEEAARLAKAQAELAMGRRVIHAPLSIFVWRITI